MPARYGRRADRIPMVGERHTAVRALADVAAGLTDHGRGKASAIQEEDRLLTTRKALLDRLQERRGTDGFGPPDAAPCAYRAHELQAFCDRRRAARV